jgi:hypothetical protein
MGKGLSGLQKDILAVLEEFPALEQTCGNYNGNWVKPTQILKRLCREPTPANRVALSKALARLCERGLVAELEGAEMHTREGIPIRSGCQAGRAS